MSPATEVRPDGFVRAGFAAGYALAGQDAFPITDRACRLLSRAYALAEQVPASRVIEASINLGRLAGVWASVYNRRAALEQAHRQLLAAAISAAVPVDDLEHAARAVLALPRQETAAPDPSVSAAAISSAESILEKASRTEAGRKWAQAVRDALAAGAAEGQADAHALLADLVDGAVIDFDLAFDDAYQAMEGLEGLWVDADAWVTRQVGDLSTELGNLWARGWRDGLSYEDMVTAAQDLLGADGNAASYLLDLAMGQSLTAGSLAVYDAEGLAQVDFLTAGDDRVDDECQDAEDGNDWPLGDVPQPPLHGNCRCTLAPVISPDLTLAGGWGDYTLGDDNG